MSSDAFAHPRVGVAAAIARKNGEEILVGMRKGSHGDGTWQFPGGHLEFREDIFKCAEREVLEETGLEVEATEIIDLTSNVFEEEKKHYITLFVNCKMLDKAAEPKVKEPNKCVEWKWTTWEDLEKLEVPKLFMPLADLVKKHSDIKEAHFKTRADMDDDNAEDDA